LDTAEVRRRNLASVFRAIDSSAQSSRTTIRAQTGLVSTSVSTLVNDLTSRGLVTESGETSTNGKGRPRRRLILNPRRAVALTVQLDRTDVIGELRDFAGGVLWQRRTPARVRPGSNEDLVETIVDMLNQLRAAAAAISGTWPMTPVVAVPSPVISGRTLGVLFQFSLGRVELSDALQRHFGDQPLPTIMNVGRLAAFGEYAAIPATRRPQSMAYLVSTGGSIAGGLVLNGETYLGSHLMAGETGHIGVDMDGPECLCGARGCLVNYLSPLELLARAGVPSETSSPEEAVDQLTALLATKDRKATIAVRQASQALASAVGTLSNLMDIELVVLGGPLTRLAPWLTPAVNALVASRSGRIPEFNPQFALSELGEDAPRIGAWRLAREAILDDPGSVPIQSRDEA